MGSFTSPINPKQLSGPLSFIAQTWWRLQISIHISFRCNHLHLVKVSWIFFFRHRGQLFFRDTSLKEDFWVKFCWGRVLWKKTPYIVNPPKKKRKLILKKKQSFWGSVFFLTKTITNHQTNITNQQTKKKSSGAPKLGELAPVSFHQAAPRFLPAERPWMDGLSPKINSAEFNQDPYNGLLRQGFYYTGIPGSFGRDELGFPWNTGCFFKGILIYWLITIPIGLLQSPYWSLSYYQRV